MYESPEYGTVETYGADQGATTAYGQMDKLKSIFDISPKVKVKLLVHPHRPRPPDRRRGARGRPRLLHEHQVHEQGARIAARLWKGEQ